MNGVKTFIHGSIELLLQSETRLNVQPWQQDTVLSRTQSFISQLKCVQTYTKKKRNGKKNKATQLTERWTDTSSQRRDLSCRATLTSTQTSRARPGPARPPEQNQPPCVLFSLQFCSLILHSHWRLLHSASLATLKSSFLPSFRTSPLSPLASFAL